MRTNLLETYSRQLKVADAYLSRNFEGKKMSNRTALTTAVLLDNTNRWLTEAMDNSVATNRTSMGDWKKFCLNLTNIAVPSLIANDLVIVHPMTSYSGSVTYLEYVSNTNKGDIKQGDLFNGVFKLGEMNEARQNFTSQVIIETAGADGAVMLTPIKNGKFDGKDIKVTHKADGSVEYLEVSAFADGKIAGVLEGDKVAYLSQEFQMESTPAKELPIIGPRLSHIPLVAEPRRIAVKYDQITAFQAKTDYGFSLDKQIAEQACGELAYEIDTEIVDMLAKEAFKDTEALNQLTWSKTLPLGVNHVMFA